MPPAPTPKPRGMRGILIALIILLAAAAAALWILRETLDKGAPSLPDIFSGGGNATGTTNATRGLGSLLGPAGTGTPPVPTAPAAPAPSDPSAPAPPPAEAPKPQNGSQVLMPFSPAEGSPASPPSSGTAGGDAVIPPAFIDDLAKFLAENYWPKGTHPSARAGGISTVSLKWANLRYGAELRGLPRQGGDTPRIRAAILDYALNASTVSRLYGAYADRFATALGTAAAGHRVGPKGQERNLTPAETREMFTIYANQARALGAALRTYAGDPAMPGRVQALLQAEQEVYAANLDYLDSMAEYERARDAKNRSAVNAAQSAMDAAAKEYQQRIQTRGRAEEALEKAMATPAARALGGDSLVYCAAWAYRRGEAKIPALRALAKSLEDIAARLQAAKTP